MTAIRSAAAIPTIKAPIHETMLAPPYLVTDTKTAKRLPETQAKKRWEKVQMFDV